MSEITTLHLTREEAKLLDRILNSAWSRAKLKLLNLTDAESDEYAEQCLRFREALP